MRKIALALLTVLLITGCGLNVSVDVNTDNDKKETENTTPAKENENLTYKNDTYRFSIELPESWKDYTVTEEKINDNTVPTFYFNLEGPQGPESLMAVAVYTKTQWAEITEEENPIEYNTKVGKNDKYVFTASGSQDNSQELYSAREDVESILKTFKAF